MFNKDRTFEVSAHPLTSAVSMCCHLNFDFYNKKAFEQFLSTPL